MANTDDAKNVKRGTDKFIRQGHTASTYGSEPNMEPKGQAGKAPRELKAN